MKPPTTTAMKIHQFLIAAALPFAFASCGEKTTVEEATDKTEAAADSAKEAVDTAADKVADAADATTEAAADAADATTEAAADAINDAADELESE